jgi:hypothetical protein
VENNLNMNIQFNQMKVFALALVFLSLFVVSGEFVSANTQGTLISGCALSSNQYACSDQITVTCNVASTWINGDISRVQFAVNSYTATATRIAGNAVNGTYQATWVNDQRFVDRAITITNVAAWTTQEWPCSSPGIDRNLPGAACDVRMGAPITASNECSCQQVRTVGPITIDNSRTVTITPSIGCADQTVATFVEFADYCDPGWVSAQSACTPTPSTSDDPFLGTTTKTYTASNPSCCALTSSAAGYKWFNHNTGSDCLPPIDHNTESVCRIQPVVQGGLDVSNNFDLDVSRVVTGFSTNTQGLDTNVFQALSYDFDGDGSQEIVSVQPGMSVSYIKLYNDKLVLLSSDDGGVNQINVTTGQMAIGGVTKYSNGSYSVLPGAKQILVPIQKLSGADKSHVYVYDVSGGTNLVLSKIMQLNDDAGVTGITCVENVCYFGELGASGNIYSYTLGASNPISWGSALTNLVGFPNVNVRLLNYRPLYIESTLTQDEFVVYFEHHIDNLTGQSVGEGTVIVTNGASAIGFHSLYSASLGGFPTTLTLKEATVIGRKLFIPYEESYSGTIDYGVYVVQLADSYSEYISNPFRSSTKIRYWSGQYFDANEGISNAVSNGLNGYLQIFSRTPSYSLAEIASISSPNILLQKASNNNLDTPSSITGLFGRSILHTGGNHVNTFFATVDGLYNIGRCGARGYSLLSGLTTVNFQFPAISPYGAGVCWPSGGGSPAGTHIVDHSLQKACVVTYGIGTSLHNGIRCVSFSDPTSITFNGAFYNSPGASSLAYGTASLDGRAIVYGSGQNSLLIYDISSNTENVGAIRVNLSSNLAATTYPRQSNLMAYNSDEDVLLTNSFILSNYNDILTYANSLSVGLNEFRQVNSSLVNFSISSFSASSLVSYMAFNYVWTSPKYVTPGGQKVKITSLSPYSSSTTLTSCTGAPITNMPNNRTAIFTALYYNSDDHVLGLVVPNLPNAASGVYPVLEVVPQLGYCNFADESNPFVYTYGVELFNGRFTSSALSSLQTFINIYDSSNKGQGSNLELLFSNSYDVNRGVGAKLVCTDTGSSWSCVSTSVTQDNCGAISVANSECTVVISFDQTRTVSSNATGSSTETITFDSTGTKVSSYFAPFVKKSFIGLADATGDGRKDVINSYGVYDLQKLSVTNYFPNAQANQRVAPLDINGDGALDVLITGAGIGTALYTAIPQAQALLTGPLDVLAFRCTQIPGTQNVNFQVAAAAPSPDSIVVSINPGDGRGFITQVTRVDGTYVLPFTRAGSYTPTVRVTSLNDVFKSATATCTLEVTQQTALVATACTMGSDGEFDYTDPIIRNGWKIVSSPSNTRPENLAPSSGKLMLPNRFAIEYPISNCGYETVSVETKLIPTENSNVFEVKGGGSESAAMNIRRSTSGPSYIYDEAGNKIHEFNWDASFNTYMALQIVFNRVSGELIYHVNGVPVYTKSKTFEPQSVKLADGGLYDYVRSTVSGSRISGSIVNPDLQNLTGNEHYLTLCAVNDISASNDLEVRRSYPNVGMYCQSTTGIAAGKCDLVELSIAVARYPSCTKEIYNYCVYDTMAWEGAGGVTGGTACSGLIIGSAGISQVAVPLGKVGWNLVVANLTWVLVISIAVVAILILASLGRRR